MVGTDRQSGHHRGELLCRVVALLLREAIHDAGLELAGLLITEIVLNQSLDLLQGPGLPLLGFHLVLQVGSVEAGEEPLGIGHTELVEDVA